jgi:flagellar basal body rod protein FlgC
MVDMISAGRAYEANIAAFNSAKGMIRSALSIGKV